MKWVDNTNGMFVIDVYLHWLCILLDFRYLRHLETLWFILRQGSVLLDFPQEAETLSKTFSFRGFEVKLRLRRVEIAQLVDWLYTTAAIFDKIQRLPKSWELPEQMVLRPNSKPRPSGYQYNELPNQISEAQLHTWWPESDTVGILYFRNGQLLSDVVALNTNWSARSILINSTPLESSWRSSLSSSLSLPWPSPSKSTTTPTRPPSRLLVPPAQFLEPQPPQSPRSLLRMAWSGAVSPVLLHVPTPVSQAIAPILTTVSAPTCPTAPRASETSADRPQTPIEFS